MFSGIVEEIGRVASVSSNAGGVALTVACCTVLAGTIIGDSIAVDGVCLTVAELSSSTFTANVQPVTARLSTLGERRVGSALNLERAVAAGQRLGGHYVQGHVDGTGRILSKRGQGAALLVEIAAPPEVLGYVVERGFVAVDGASLTVAELADASFTVSLVYHTQQHITLADLPTGARVNLEADVIAKYVERLIEPHQPRGISVEMLRRAGYTADGEDG
jgi:riboflavin synthase